MMKHFLKLFAVFSMLLLTHLAQAQPQISADPSSLDLGDQTVPQISNPQNVTITNVGDEDLQIQGTQVIGQNSLVFLIQEDLCAFQTISPGDTCIIGVAFKPNVSGIQTAQLILVSNDPNDPNFAIDLMGNGKLTGGCSLSNAPLSGGFVAILIFLITIWMALTIPNRWQPALQRR